LERFLVAETSRMGKPVRCLGLVAEHVSKQPGLKHGPIVATPGRLDEPGVRGSHALHVAVVKKVGGLQPHALGVANRRSRISPTLGRRVVTTLVRGLGKQCVRVLITGWARLTV
jgi:hypothetical protein